MKSRVNLNTDDVTIRIATEHEIRSIHVNQSKIARFNNKNYQTLSVLYPSLNLIY